MTIANGSVASATDVLAMSNIRQVYTGAGFNSSPTASAGTYTQDHELDAVASAPDSNYVVVKITGTHNMGSAGLSNTVKTELKSQIKETGGAYADIVAYKTIDQAAADVSGTIHTLTYRIIATLTAGQKTNGFQIKVFSQSTTTNASQTCSFTNIQTTQEVRT